MATGFLDVIDSYFTCEFTTIGRSRSRQTWPVTHHSARRGVT